MRLKISDCEIARELLVYVSLSIGPYPVSFGGVVGLEEATSLVRKLKLLTQEKALPYEAVDKDGVDSSGICNLIHLKFERTATHPPMIRFSGQLAHPFIA